MPTKPRPGFAAIHGKLRAILRKHEKGTLKANPDKPGNYGLIGPPTDNSNGKDVWFGAVLLMKQK